MAEYRRFISYMYLYEDGRKTINSGFVRVESRDGQCRVSVHMTGIFGSEENDYRVYMLVREPGCYIGIAVGELVIRQQSGNMELLMDSEHLMGTEYSLSRITGMVLLGENGRIYGTRWDDEPLETDKFVNEEQLSRILVRFGDKDNNEAVSEAAAAAGIERDSGNAVSDESDTERRLENVAAKNEIAEDTDDYNLQAIRQRDSAQSVDENPLIPEEELVSEFTEDLKDMEKNYSENAVKSVMVASDAVLEETESLQELQQAQTQPMNAYDLLMSQLPQMYPFEDDSVESCVRMELQDIGRMPMSCWIYGSNSFLLHGYYCYRHLILAKAVREKESGKDGMAENEDVYMMGVPGIWQHREQYMASMFGFRTFKPVSHEKQRSGAFGYWCVELK